MKLPRLRRRPDLLRGAASGLVGGLAGAWTMNHFQSLVSKIKGDCDGSSGQQDSEGSEDATVKMASWLLEFAAGIKLSKEQKKAAGPIVHYAFGAAMGALYGGLLEYKRHSGLGDGALLGTGLFIGADEIAVPALGLSQPPAEYPLSVHATALSAHLVYGMTAEMVRKKVRRALVLI